MLSVAEGRHNWVKNVTIYSIYPRMIFLFFLTIAFAREACWSKDMS